VNPLLYVIGTALMAVAPSQAMAQSIDSVIQALPKNPLLSTNSSGNPTADLDKVLERAVNLLLWAAYPLAFFGIIYSAFQLANPVGKADGYAEAKKHFINTFVGAAIIIVGLYVIRAIISLIG